MPGNIIQGDFFDEIHILGDHIHSRMMCMPAQADPILLSTTASAWNNATVRNEIMASAAAPSDMFDIHWAIISDISANGYYELAVFKGPAGSETEIACVPFFKNVGAPGEATVPVVTPLIPPGTRISAGLRSSPAAINTCRVKLGYHEY